MDHPSRSAVLARAQLKRLRPTQLTVGYAEVELKARRWGRLGKKQRKTEIDQHVFPAVLGPGRDYFIVDHHHLGIALIEQGVEEVSVTVLDDLSWLERMVFWRTMEFRSWAHPYDNRGIRRDYGDIPQRLTQLEDDPYRSLAGLVRTAGGFAKDQAPFVEFLWADFFRPRVTAKTIDKDPGRATREGLRLARSKEARYLPGWSGKASV
ncbi:MAG: chromosome partitioning protein ParB [Pseudomonadota bacterium]|nr:chromosome partitioning protein ParB [Pseudomonadota bacterium]